MRTPPAKFLADVNSGKPFFFLLVVEGSATTYYWHTARQSFTLWPDRALSHGGYGLAKDATQISQIADGGIASISSQLDIEDFGGGLGSVSDFTFRILNQDGIGVSLQSQVFINNTVQLRVGFVDSTSGVGVNDTLLLANYLIDSIPGWTWEYCEFHCTDPTINLGETYPKETVNKSVYLRAPEESYGKSIPLLYGDFLTYNTATLSGVLKNRHIEKFDLAPSVIASYGDVTAYTLFPSHVFAGHAVHTIGEVFTVSDDGAIGLVSASNYNTVNNASRSGIDLSSLFGVTFYIIPDGKYSVNTSAQSPPSAIYDYAVDKDITYGFQATVGYVYFQLTRRPEGSPALSGGDWVITMRTLYGGITSPGADYVSQVGSIVGLTWSSNSQHSVNANQNSVRSVDLNFGSLASVQRLMDDFLFGYVITTNCIANINITTLEIPMTVSTKFGTVIQKRIVSTAGSGYSRGGHR